jgi:hypothetical protein
LLDHQVHLQREARHPTEGPHNQRANGDIGHKMAIHDVNVNGVGASLLRLPYLFSQSGKIG